MKSNLLSFKILLLLSLAFALSFIIIGKAYSQDLKIYDTNRMGIKNLAPSIVIDENTLTGDYSVYSVSKHGLRNITPDAIIEDDEYSGTWKMYRKAIMV